MVRERRFRDGRERQKPEIGASWKTRESRVARVLSTFRAEPCAERLSIGRRKAPGEAPGGLADRLDSEIRRHEVRLRQGADRFRDGLRGATWQTAS